MRLPRLSAFAAILVALGGTAAAWDSNKLNPTHPTHEYLTEYGIDHAGVAEAVQYRKQLIDGANQELHELPVDGNRYGINLEAFRRRLGGTNAGVENIGGVWREVFTAYQLGNRERAYFVLGIMLHYIEDMGVPAHANGVYHQGNATEFDNFEAMALSNWKPDFASVNRADPKFANPSDYYAFSQAWARADAPDYDDPDSFSKTWLTASKAERALLSSRQARTAMVVTWTLKSAARALGAP